MFKDEPREKEAFGEEVYSYRMEETVLEVSRGQKKRSTHKTYNTQKKKAIKKPWNTLNSKTFLPLIASSALISVVTSSPCPVTFCTAVMRCSSFEDG